MNNTVTREEVDGEINKIDLIQLITIAFHYFCRYWWVLIICLLLGIVSTVGYNRVTYNPMYRATATFTVATDDDHYGSLYSYYYSQNTADQLSNTFPYFLNSRYFKNALLEKMDRPSMNGTLKSSTLWDSNVVTMTMDSPSAQDALDYLQTAIDIYPKAAKFVLGNIKFSMIESPSLPTAPYNTLSLKRQIVYGGFLGAVLAALIYIVLGLTNRKVISSETLDKYTNMNCLAHMPFIKQKVRTRKTKTSILVDNNRTLRSYRDSIGTLKMRIMRVMRKDDAKALLITSTKPKEGKTTTAVNLAISLAKEGNKVILFDADLKKSNCAKALGIELQAGMRNLHNGGTEFSRLLTPTGRDNLWIVGNNSEMDFPAMALSSKDMKEWFEKAREEVDYIVIDAPACTMYQNALLMTEYADEVLYIIQYNQLTYKEIQKGLGVIDNGNAKLLGYAFNQSPEHISGYGYGKYGYGYSKYGSYGYGKYGYGKYGRYGKYGYGKYGSYAKKE
ncbi:Tyrosine-protein kinase Wzc [Lachnospiraceae bacterium TWA4]|nr:Tyrosine-protein kinase Wzc [Lachnospiraceae bacterium TWA4]